MVQPKSMLIAMSIPLALCFCLDASAQLYKWTDKNGKVQYSDTPPPADAKSSSALKVDAAPPPAPARSGTLSEQEKAFQKRRNDLAASATKAETEKVSAEEKANRCGEARAYLATLNDGGRIARTNAQGERELLNDEDIDRQKLRAQRAINESCGR
jgi:Domain of unknown function (DUF4124)